MLSLPRFLPLLALALLTSCATGVLPDGAVFGPFYRPENVSRPDEALPLDVVRIAVLVPADRTPGHSLTPETLAELHQILIRSLTQSARFELVALNQTQLTALTNSGPLTSDGEIPSDLLVKIAALHQAQGILLTDITSYSPYPPLALGLRTKLARLDSSKILWATDHLYHASDPRVANSARKYAIAHGTHRGPGNLSHTILQNPSRFAEFVTSSLCETLPRR